jgi:hypothetical protein
MKKLLNWKDGWWRLRRNYSILKTDAKSLPMIREIEKML